MTAFSFLSAFVRALFALWALLLCLTDIGSAVLAAVRKRLRPSIVALLLFAPIYLLWQVIFDYSLFGKTGRVAVLTQTLCAIPVAYWLLAFVLFTAASLLLILWNIRYDKAFINPGTIKLFLDKIPCGICCWQEDGRVLFSNLCMNELCIALTGSPLLNGNQLREALQDNILNVDGKVWRFAVREIERSSERLFELIASDITAEYAQTQVLEKEKAELSRLNQELREYYESIDESVKHQEILQAKMNIHDEMNRLMLSTVATDETDMQALDNIFSLWEQNALLLCMEADKKSARQESSLEALAATLGVRLSKQGTLPPTVTNEQRTLFFATAREALINAVKHAGAKTMEIVFVKEEAALICRFVNDGSMPEGEVLFEGGLANIAALAAKLGASISVEMDEKFTLVLRL